MKVLITGMSGTGKSTVVEAMAKAGWRAVDLDVNGWSHWVPCEGNPTGATPGYDWMWDEARLVELLTEATDEPLFLAGCGPNMGLFTSLFDRIILLSAPAEVLLARVAVRTNNPYGKTTAEAERIVANLEEVEPLLRRIATNEIDATQSPEVVLDAVVSAAN
ncbi:AAA family ATPase [Algihabitans sp.]|uniref:AAA family ATPase n=1 Tax=Algihabitans sp. TaxID=2821514 RepID=UPI003BA85DC2